MNKSLQHDFTQGSLPKQLVAFSAPIIATNLLQTSYQFIDSLWIGNLLGAEALAASAVAGTVIFTILSFIIGLNNASLTILSQQKGKQDAAGLARYLNAFVVTLLVLSLLMGLLGFLSSERLLSLLGTPTSIMLQARQYLQINCFGILFLMGYNFIGTVLRAVGNSRTPMRFVLLAVVLNALLDPLMILGLHLGMNGAALATVFSQGFAFLYGMLFVLRNRLVPFTAPSVPSRNDVLLILKLGIPSGLQMAVISAGSTAIMSVVTTFGSAVVAGYGAAQRLGSVLMLPAQSLGTAVNSIAGQNIGVKQWERVGQTARYGLLYNLTMMMVIALILVFFSGWGIQLFIHDSQSVQFGAAYLKWLGLFYPFLGINFILNGIVRASGAMVQVLALNVISFWLLRFPLAKLCSMAMGQHGIAVGIGISFMISSLVASAYYRYGGWRRRRLYTKS